MRDGLPSDEPLGARTGQTLARLAVASGYDVGVSNSRGPETLSALVKELGPRARAGTAVEAAKAGEIVAVTVPLKAYRQVPVEPLAGKVVIDTNNYYPDRDGTSPSSTTSPRRRRSSCRRRGATVSEGCVGARAGRSPPLPGAAGAFLWSFLGRS